MTGIKSNYSDAVCRQRLMYPRAYDPWTIGEDDKLAELFSSGASIEDLSKELKRSPGAITSALKLLNLIGE